MMPYFIFFLILLYFDQAEELIHSLLCPQACSVQQHLNLPGWGSSLLLTSESPLPALSRVFIKKIKHPSAQGPDFFSCRWIADTSQLQGSGGILLCTFCSALWTFPSVLCWLGATETEWEEYHRTKQNHWIKGKNCIADRGDLVDIRTVGSVLLPLLCVLNSQNF